MKLSIITINCNNREGLRRTIDSVICQTWKDYEWIIIDGGSTDGSKELIWQYQDHFALWCSGKPDLINEQNGIVCRDFTVEALVLGVKEAMSHNYSSEHIRQDS